MRSIPAEAPRKARRPFQLNCLGREAFHRLGVLETPRVSFECPHEHRVVGGDAERDQDRLLVAIDRGELDAGPSEVQIRREDLEAGLDRFQVVCDERA